MKNKEKDISDMELIRGYLAGSAQDFECLYLRYRKQLYAYLNTLLDQDRAIADDVFQQTWLKVIDHLPEYKDKNMFLAYLLRIAHNVAMDVCRKKMRMEQYVTFSASAASSASAGEEKEDKFPEDLRGDLRYIPGKDMENRELASAIDKAVNTLKGELKEVFLLRMEDLSFKEIAEIQKCSINTVLARMQYALKNLRETLKEWKEHI